MTDGDDFASDAEAPTDQAADTSVETLSEAEPDQSAEALGEPVEAADAAAPLAGDQGSDTTGSERLNSALTQDLAGDQGADTSPETLEEDLRDESPEVLNESSGDAPDEAEAGAERETPPRPEDRGIEQIREVNSEAWENRGYFHVERDEQGRVASIEGWLSLRSEERSGADKALQREAVENAPERDFEWQGGHLIGHALGGPTIEANGQETAEANLIPMEQRTNSSYVGGYEALIARELRENPERGIYMRANIHRDEDGMAGAVSHETFVKGKDDLPEPFIGSRMNVDQRPEQTVGAIIGQSTGQQASDFYSRDPEAGVVPHKH